MRMSTQAIFSMTIGIDGMQLADYGNRIPSLTFEVIADDGTVTLADIAGDQVRLATGSALPQRFTGFAASGSDAGGVLAAIGAAVPLSCADAADGLRLAEAALLPADIGEIAAADIVRGTGEDGQADGIARSRQPLRGAPADLALRYYDPARDYQSGLRHARHAQAGQQSEEIDLPAVLAVEAAQALADRLYRIKSAAQHRMTLQVAAIDAAMMPGRVLRVAGGHDLWRVQGWQWRGQGALLELVRHIGAVPGGGSAASLPDEQPGRIVAPEDSVAGPTVLRALDLPPAPGQAGEGPVLTLALAGESAGWRGAAIYKVEPGGDLTQTGLSARQAACIGTARTALPPASALTTDTAHHVDVRMQHGDMVLTGASPQQLAGGANLAALGREVIQFLQAEPVGPQSYRLTGLWRGRGGTEYAVDGHEAGEDFVLLDDAVLTVPVAAGERARFAAIGAGDEDPVIAAAPPGLRSVQPFAPVHLAATWTMAGDLALSWVRRSRAGYAWLDYADVPLAEDSESYAVEIAAGETVLHGAKRGAAVRAGCGGAATRSTPLDIRRPRATPVSRKPHGSTSGSGRSLSGRYGDWVGSGAGSRTCGIITAPRNAAPAFAVRTPDPSTPTHESEMIWLCLLNPPPHATDCRCFSPDRRKRKCFTTKRWPRSMRLLRRWCRAKPPTRARLIPNRGRPG